MTYTRPIFSIAMMVYFPQVKLLIEVNYVPINKFVPILCISYVMIDSHALNWNNMEKHPVPIRKEFNP